MVHFHEDLVDKSSPNLRHVDIVALTNDVQLQEFNKNQLIQPIQDPEIWEALKGIGENKAPGIDGFTSKFFKSTWEVTKIDVQEDIHDFFIIKECTL